MKAPVKNRQGINLIEKPCDFLRGYFYNVFTVDRIQYIIYIIKLHKSWNVRQSMVQVTEFVNPKSLIEINAHAIIST